MLELMVQDNFGLARLIQAVESLRFGLVSREGFQSFFVDVHRHWSTSGKAWNEAWDEVARGVVDNAQGRRGHVRRTPCSPDHQAPHDGLTTAVDERLWHKWHVVGNVEALTDLGLALPSLPIGADPIAKQDFERLVASAHWSEPSLAHQGAWLGRPSQQNANCWVSSRQLSPAASPEEQFDNAQQALAARGVPIDPNLAAVVYHIDTKQLPQRTGDEPPFGCRPGLADCGSVWFRVHSTGSAAERHQAHEWGSTVNLHRLDLPDTSDTGLPERVIASIPVNSPAVIKRELLPAQAGATTTPAPDAKEFVRKLKNRRTKAEIVQAVLEGLMHPNLIDSATSAS